MGVWKWPGDEGLCARAKAKAEAKAKAKEAEGVEVTELDGASEPEERWED